MIFFAKNSIMIQKLLHKTIIKILLKILKKKKAKISKKVLIFIFYCDIITKSQTMLLWLSR